MALTGIKGSYIHTQTTAASTWTITHNLNSTEVNIDVIVDNAGTREKILPQDITIVDANTVSVAFSTALTGSARVVA